MRFLILLGAALLAAPATAAPQPAAAAEGVDPAAIEAARELLRGLGLEEQMEANARESAQATFDTMVAATEERHGIEMPDDLRNRLMGILMETVDATITDLKRTALDDYASIYARNFTAEELRELGRLHREPVMVKYLQIAPRFEAELMQIEIAATVKRMPAMREKIAKELSDWAAREKLRQLPSRS